MLLNRTMNVISRPFILLDPPFFDCRAPHLGCALLATALREAGHAVLIRDLNQEALEWLLSPSQLRSAQTRVAEKRERLFRTETPRQDPAFGRYLQSYRAGAGFAEAVQRAVRELRTPATFFDPVIHTAARRTVDAALDLHALSTGDDVYMHVGPEEYNTRHRATSVAGLLSAAADHAGNLFFPFFESVVVPEVEALNPLGVGISISTAFQVVPGITLAQALRAAGIFVIVGGPFFSKFVPQLLGHPAFFDLVDAVGVGDGEPVVRSLVPCLREGGDIGRIPNLVYRRGAVPVSTEMQVASGIPEFGPADFRDLHLDRYLIPEPVLPLHAGKGCPWGLCTFCEVPQINSQFAHSRRTRNGREIARDMAEQGRRHGARHFLLTDESLEPELLNQLADETLAGSLDVRYIGYTRFSKAFTPDFCAKLFAAGCRKLLIGLESGSQAVNDRCQKGVDLKCVPEVLHACQSAGIAVHVFSIMGLPGEGPDELAASAEYLTALAKELNAPYSTMGVGPFYLNWNSRLRQDPEEAGLSFTTDKDFPLHADAYAYSNGLTDRAIAEFAQGVYRRLCWARSPLGFDISYANPVCPGWEEYALLYLSQGERSRSLPDTLKSALAGTVRVARDLSAWPSPGCEPDRVIAASPAARAVELQRFEFDILSSRPEHKLSDLAAQLQSHHNCGAGEALARAIFFLHAGTLHWTGELCAPPGRKAIGELQ